MIEISSRWCKGNVVASIFENLDIQTLPSRPTTASSTIFRIADLGCSAGPNTFIQVKNIIDAVSQKYHQSAVELPELQVYFSDLVSNDFNYLFATLPRDKQYFAAGVPGSFHGRLFPKASLNFVYSAYALHWLSKLPQVLSDANSPAFNKVGQAYSAQYAKDIECFFHARGQELAPGGLMVLLIPGRPHGTLPAQGSLAPFFAPLESTLADMVNDGLLSEDKFDSFNLPFYCPSVEELRTLIEENGCFDILKLEIEAAQTPAYPSVQQCRAGMEGILKKHFGDEIIELLFDRYLLKERNWSTI
ncbi:S-adenosyl-L-methionine-dependent methyltransferases superfamily protein, partial [Prunus dulcis]